MPYEYVNRTTDRNKSDKRQEISCPVHSHYVALLFVGLRSCHSGCAQQALPECSAHQYYSFRPYSGYHLSGLFPDGNTCWLLYQPVWLSPWRGLRSAPLWCGRFALYPGCCGGQFLSIPALPFHYRVRFGVSGNSRQSLCYRTGCQGNSYQPTELIAVV